MDEKFYIYIVSFYLCTVLCEGEVAHAHPADSTMEVTVELRLDSGVSDTNRIMSNGACAIAIAELNIRSVASFMHYRRQFDLYDSLNHTILAFPVLMFW